MPRTGAIAVYRLPDVDPPVCNLPDRDKNFVDRDKDMPRIRRALEAHRVAVVRSEPDLPVSGKTATAIEFAYRNHIHYEVVWKFDCRDWRGLADQQDELERAVVEQGVVAGRRWLLLLDGVDGDVDDAVARFHRRYPEVLPDFLITARHPDGYPDYPDGDDERFVTLGRLGRRDSALLLWKIAPETGRPAVDGTNGLAGGSADPADTLAHILADILGGRPALLQEVGLLIAKGDVAAASPRLLRMLSPPDGRNSSSTAAGHGSPRPEPRPRSGDLRIPGSVGPPAAGPGADDRGSAPRGRVNQQDLIGMAMGLESLDFMSDPTSRNVWLALIEEQSRRSVPVSQTPYIRTSMMQLLLFAIKQPTSDVLVAIEDAADALGVGDPKIQDVRDAAALLHRRWTAPLDADGVRDFPLDGPRPTWSARSIRADPTTRGKLVSVADYTFFTSYVARPGDRDLVTAFHNDLQREVRVQMDRSPEPRGFLAREDIRPGSAWEDELRQAVRTVPVMVALLSDDYFRSRWCGWEWAVLAERIRRASAAFGGAGLAPVGILPVRWLKIRQSIPAAVNRIQEIGLESGADDNTWLANFMRQQPTEYRNFLIRLAGLVKDAAMAAALPPLATADAAALPPAFGAAAAASATQPTTGTGASLPRQAGSAATPSPNAGGGAPAAGRVSGMPAPSAGRLAASRIGFPELINLVESLESLAFMADLPSRRHWLEIVEERSSQRIQLSETTEFRTYLISLLRFAARLPTPAVLGAVADATEALAPGDPTTGLIRAEVEALRARW